MPSILSVLRQAWIFCREQEALGHVALWLLFLPALLNNLLLPFTDTSLNTETFVLLVSIHIIISLVIMWGTICVLAAGKRLLQAKAGRKKTSFKAVRQQAAPSFIPYLLTSIMQGVAMLLWSLLLIIPGIVYAVRTVFYPVIVVCEGTAYRQALRRSKEVTKGKFWSVLGSILVLSFFTIIPGETVSGLLLELAKHGGSTAYVAASAASAFLLTILGILYTLSLILLYDHFKPSTKPVRN